tara:strand:+ start:4525 stop:5028 length:504 start_codon:yes stop_codon:yes gene_type:complete
MYEYKIKVTRVVDGDTIKVDLDMGFDHYQKDTIRLMGIDTPESRTSNLKEKALGLASKQFLKQILAENKGDVILKTTKEGKGKFGRILGTLTIGSTGQNVNELLIANGHARPYFGGSKDELGSWVKEEGECDLARHRGYCDGKKLKKNDPECSGIWYRWTSSGYMEL